MTKRTVANNFLYYIFCGYANIFMWEVKNMICLNLERTVPEQL